MRILNWIQGKKKPNGRKGSKETASISTKNEMAQYTHREEFSSCPRGLLAIGTFGDENLTRVHSKQFRGNPSSSLQHHLQHLTPEELRELEKEFVLLLDEQLKQSSPSLELEESSKQFPSNPFLNRKSSFKSERTKTKPNSDELNESRHSFHHVMLSKGKDVCTEASDTTVIGRRTLSFLLKQIFVCKGGFAPAVVAPPLRIPILESRMEKMLRTILHKQIYPQSSKLRTSSMKKYLKKRNTSKDENKEEDNDKTGDGSKWVQTDSEYIVLEI